MKIRKSNNIRIPGITAFAFILFISLAAQAQHRGDNLAFQGLDIVNTSGVKALALGGAYTAISGELDAMFWNPAGLVGLPGFQLSINANSYQKIWRETQYYRPNRQLVTMSFILDGLYSPNPQYNGWYDNEAFLDDSTYIVQEPELGKDTYSEDAADWQKKVDDFGLNNIAAALPLNLMGKTFVVSAGYNKQVLVMNYDRNQTYLDPHPAYDGYGAMPPRVTSTEDSIRVNWSDFERERMGPLQNITTAIAFELNKHIGLGLALNFLSGETDDFQSSKRLGYFDLVQGYNVFRFSYDTLDVLTNGTAKFSTTSLDLGVIAKFEKFSLGARLRFPHTFTKQWNYKTVTSNPDTSFSISNSGEDKMKTPLAYSLGLSLNPVSKFRIAFDLEHRPYNDIEFTFNVEDTTCRKWIDQTSFRIGIEFIPIEKLSLLAGYRNIPNVFIPDGAAIKDKGPVSESYTFGFSLKALMGRFDFAYEIRTLKYYDVYYSNTNWAYEKNTNFMFGYTFMF